LAFLVWVFFLDADNLFSHYKHRKELKELKARKTFLVTETENEIKMNDQLTNNPLIIEKTARELYFMKRSNEDVFVEE
jgi:cell division protein DivIC